MFIWSSKRLLTQIASKAAAFIPTDPKLQFEQKKDKAEQQLDPVTGMLVANNSSHYWLYF